MRAARKAAEKGFKVAIAEKQYWGGTCVNAGCVPKKLLVTAAEFGDWTLASSYGWESRDLRPNWTLLRDRIAGKTHQLAGIYKKSSCECRRAYYGSRSPISFQQRDFVGRESLSGKDRFNCHRRKNRVFPKSRGVNLSSHPMICFV